MAEKEGPASNTNGAPSKMRSDHFPVWAHLCTGLKGLTCSGSFARPNQHPYTCRKRKPYQWKRYGLLIINISLTGLRQWDWVYRKTVSGK